MRLCLVNNAQAMKNTLSDKRLAILGAGKIGGILLRAFLEQKLVAPKRVHATVLHAEKAQALAEQLGVRASSDNRAAVRDADIVLLALKPQAVREVLEEIKPEIKPGKLIVSVAASVPTAYMEKILGLDVPVVRGFYSYYPVSSVKPSATEVMPVGMDQPQTMQNFQPTGDMDGEFEDGAALEPCVMAK